MPGFYLPSEDEFDPSNDDFIHESLSKERRYRHFDLPVIKSQRAQSIDFGTEDTKHRFFPLLGFTDEVRKFSKNDRGERVQTTKSRPIRFAGHADAAYLQAYAEFLNGYYEAALRRDGTSGSVLAYRKGGATNIHHAKSLFDEIRMRGDCCVFALDISGFFDCLDHEYLRQELANLVGVERLEGHHWTVFRNVTRYSWVETVDLDHLLGRKRNRMGRVCSPKDFKDNVQGRKSGLVRTHELPFGIPQGTPISGLYANLYLRSFDREMVALAHEHGGSYRRYSDDIAIVLPLGAKPRHVVSVVEKLLADSELALSAGKTETAFYGGGRLTSGKPIQYLGFTFDGEETLIRASSLGAYLAKMKRGIHAKLVAAKKKRIPSTEVFRRELLSRYTHLGKRRNFLKYVYRAADIMGAPEIRQQVKSHMTWFDRAWKQQVIQVYGGLVDVE